MLAVGCENYGYDKPTTEDTCHRYGTGSGTIYLAHPEPCNTTYACYDPIHQIAFNSGKFGSNDTLYKPYAPQRILFQAAVYCYWVLFIFIGSFVLLSLFIGAITIGMQGSMDEAKETKEEIEREKKAKDRQTRRQQIVDDDCYVIHTAWSSKRKAKPARDEAKLRYKPPRNRIIVGFLRVAEECRRLTEWSVFNHSITVIILIASTMVGLNEDDHVWAAINSCKTVPCAKGETHVTDAIDLAILVLFALECLLKILAEGLQPWRYLVAGWPPKINYWNLFDFAIVIAGAVPGEGGILMVLRLLRLLRVLKLVRALPELQVIVSALISGVASISYVSMLLFLIYYIYAIVGCILFASNDPWHFRDVFNAMLTLFRASTFEDWTDIMSINMYGCDKHFFYRTGTPSLLCDNHALGFEASARPIIASVYFVTFIILAALVMMSLFIGVVTTSMETEQYKVRDAKAEAEKVQQIRLAYGLTEERVADFKCIFDEFILAPNVDTISSDDLKFLLRVLSDNKMAPLEIEERIDSVLGEKDSGELRFSEVLSVLGDLQRDKSMQTAEVGSPSPAPSRASETTSPDGHSQDGNHGSSAKGSLVRQRSYIDDKRRIVLPETDLKKSQASKVRRLLEHAEAFDFPEDVKLEGMALSQLISFVAAMNLHAKEVKEQAHSGPSMRASCAANSRFLAATRCSRASHAARASFFAVPPAPENSLQPGAMEDGDHDEKAHPDHDLLSAVAAQCAAPTKADPHTTDDIPTKVEERLLELQRLLETGLRFRTTRAQRANELLDSETQEQRPQIAVDADRRAEITETQEQRPQIAVAADRHAEMTGPKQVV